jgi:hypothetical protein
MSQVLKFQRVFSDKLFAVCNDSNKPVDLGDLCYIEPNDTSLLRNNEIRELLEYICSPPDTRNFELIHNHNSLSIRNDYDNTITSVGHAYIVGISHLFHTVVYHVDNSNHVSIKLTYIGNSAILNTVAQISTGFAVDFKKKLFRIADINICLTIQENTIITTTEPKLFLIEFIAACKTLIADLNRKKKASKQSVKAKVRKLMAKQQFEVEF